jgi:hypothetical protein
VPSRRRLIAAAWLAAPMAAATQAVRVEDARVWRVAAGESLAAALRQARDGDTLELLAGVHRAQAGVIEQSRLVVRGVGGPVVLQADGAHAEGKGLLVVRQGDVRIEGLTFRGVRVRDGNGAGIRFERGRLVLRDCAFFDNQIGLLSGNDGHAELDIEGCRFGDAPVVPPDAGFTHLLYAGRIGRLRVARSRFHGGRHGHLVKSRAAEHEIVGNWLGDATAGSGGASYELEFPNGGRARVQGNVLLQGPLSGNRTLLAFGAEGEGAGHRSHRLELLGNSFVNLGSDAGIAVRVHGERLTSAVAAVARDNLYLGALRVPAPFDAASSGNLSAPLAAADLASGRFTLRGRRAPPGAEPG